MSIQNEGIMDDKAQGEKMILQKRSGQTAIMTLILACLALYAALTGILDKNLYGALVSVGAMPKRMLWSCVTQDIISVPLAVSLLMLSIMFLRRPGDKLFISMLGLAWYFFYAFGLYVIQGQYTSIYLGYLAIWGLSIYSLIWGITSFAPERIEGFRLPGLIRKCISGYLVMILVILVPGWLLKMTPDLARHLPGDTYGVFVLDLSIVFPAFGLIAYQLWRNKPWGNLLAGIALLKGLTLCLAWAFAQLSAPLAGYPLEVGMAIISSGLTIVALALFIPYMVKLET